MTRNRVQSVLLLVSSIQSLSRVRLFATPWTASIFIYYSVYLFSSFSKNNSCPCDKDLAIPLEGGGGGRAGRE